MAEYEMMTEYTIKQQVWARAIKQLLPGLSPLNPSRGADWCITFEQYKKLTGRWIDDQAKVEIILHRDAGNDVDIRVGGDILPDVAEHILSTIVAAVACAAYPMSGRPYTVCDHVCSGCGLQSPYARRTLLRQRLLAWTRYMDAMPVLHHDQDIWPSKRARRHYVRACHQVARVWMMSCLDYLRGLDEALWLKGDNAPATDSGRPWARMIDVLWHMPASVGAWRWMDYSNHSLRLLEMR